eukprot:6427408-Prymnesium_polylepis.1
MALIGWNGLEHAKLPASMPIETWPEPADREPTKRRVTGEPHQDGDYLFRKGSKKPSGAWKNKPKWEYRSMVANGTRQSEPPGARGARDKILCARL